MSENNDLDLDLDLDEQVPASQQAEPVKVPVTKPAVMNKPNKRKDCPKPLRKYFYTLFGGIGAISFTTATVLGATMGCVYNKNLSKPVTLSSQVSSQGVSVKKYDISKNKDSYVELNIPENKEITDITIKISTSVLTKEQVKIEGTKISISADKMIDDKIIIDTITLIDIPPVEIKTINLIKSAISAIDTTLPDKVTSESMSITFNASLKEGTQNGQFVFTDLTTSTSVMTDLITLTTEKSKDISLDFKPIFDKMTTPSSNVTVVWQEQKQYLEAVEYEPARENECMVKATEAGFTAKDIIIPEKIGNKTVTGIADHAFVKSETETALLETITFQNSSNITYLGTGALEGCMKLKSIVIPKNVKTINADFLSFNSLVTGSPAIQSILFEEGSICEEIQECAFCNCNGVKYLYLPNKLKTIGELAFSSWYTLETLNIPASVETIGYRAFHGGTRSQMHLKKINFENTSSNTSHLTQIGEMAFLHQPLVESITIPASVTRIGSKAFANEADESANLFSVTFQTGSKLEAILPYTFENCVNLETITIPSSVQRIGFGAFLNTGLKTVTFDYPTEWKKYNSDDIDVGTDSEGKKKNAQMLKTTGEEGWASNTLVHKSLKYLELNWDETASAYTIDNPIQANKNIEYIVWINNTNNNSFDSLALSSDLEKSSAYNFSVIYQYHNDQPISWIYDTTDPNYPYLKGDDSILFGTAEFKIKISQDVDEFYPICYLTEK